jgi:hypothetical protein
VGAARDCYGVVIDLARKRVDTKATRKLRKEMRARGPRIHNKDVKIVQTVLFRNKSKKDLSEVRRLLPRSVLCVNANGDAIVAKFIGRDYERVAKEINGLKSRLGEARILTTQFVPGGFREPRAGDSPI